MQQNRRSQGTGASLMVQTHTHTHTNANTHTWRTILGLWLISSLSCVRGFPRHPAHACTYTHRPPQTRGGGLERASTPRRMADRGMHADEPDSRQETLESSRGYFPSSLLLQGPRAGKEIKTHNSLKKKT